MQTFDCGASDERAIFANIAFKMLWQKYQGNYSSITFQNEARELAMYFDEYVRNIYEVIDSEIPMMAWTNFLKYGFDASAFDEEDEMTSEKRLSMIYDACKKYYS